MDYTALLTNISTNQVELINILKNIQDLVSIIGFLFAIYFVYILIRNMIKSR